MPTIRFLAVVAAAAASAAQMPPAAAHDPAGSGECVAQCLKECGGAGGESRVVLRRVGAPKPDGTDPQWTTVRSGMMVVEGHGYKGTATWDEPPSEIGEKGFSTKLNVTAECSHGQRLAAGLSLSGDFDMSGTNHPNPVGRVDFPANCDASAGGKVANGGGGTIQVVPRKYAPGAKVLLRYGMFWGRKVDYEYEAVSQ